MEKEKQKQKLSFKLGKYVGYALSFAWGAIFTLFTIWLIKLLVTLILK